MSKYIDAEKLIAEIERFRASEYGGNTLGDDVANGALDYVLEEIIPPLQQEAEDERIKKNKEAQEASIKYRDSVIQRIERKRVFPSFKGELLHSFKNELHTMEQILGIKNWSNIQYALFEKFALVFATWGGYHFHPKETESEDSIQQEEPVVDLEKELDQWRHKHFKGKRDGNYNGEYLERESQLDLAHYFCQLGLNARKEE